MPARRTAVAKRSPRGRQTAREARARIKVYLARQTPAAKRALGIIARAIRTAVPRAEDAFSYQIPAFTLDGRILIWYAGWKRHVSIYPITPALRRAYGIDLRDYRAAKGTVQFDPDEPIPVTLVKRLARARAAELRKARKR